MNTEAVNCGSTVLIRDKDIRQILEVLEVFSYREIRDCTEKYINEKISNIHNKWKSNNKHII